MNYLYLLQAGICALLAVVYTLRPDTLAAVTILPAWIWLILFGFLPLTLIRKPYKAILLLPVATWLLFTILHIEEPRSLIRGFFLPATIEKSEGALRIITINCGGGQTRALSELTSFDPDILLLTESPPLADIQSFARDLFGDEHAYVFNADTSIIVRGELIDVRSNHNQRILYSHAIFRRTGMDPIHLFSVRLPPSMIRLDWWNPACWITHQTMREIQMNQMRLLISELPHSGAVVFGGDFNAPQGDRIFQLIPESMIDTFARSGRGLGNTIINDIPVLRIDQIWASDSFTTHQSFVHASSHSDHRIVISDLIRKPNR